MVEKNFANAYPMTKFVFTLCFCVISVAMQNIIGLVVCFVILNLLALTTGVFKGFFKLVYFGLGFLVLLMLVLQGLFYPGETILFSFWIFSVKLEGILYAAKLGLTLTNVAGSFIWFFQATTHKDFMYALEKAGVPNKITFVILSTLQMIPVLQKRSNTILNAQKARGVETEGNVFVRMKVFIPTIGPLILSSISNTEERALTLEARGFSAPVDKTHLYMLEETKKDKTLKKVFIGLTVLFIIGRVIVWQL